MLKIAKIWQGQFSLKLLSMKYDDPRIFAVSEWQTDKTRPHSLYLIYRWIYVLIWTSCLVFSILDVDHWSNPHYQTLEFKVKWLTYLTHWGFALCSVQALLGAILVTKWYRNGGGTDSETGLHLYKAYWATYTAAYPIAFGITILYWTIIHKGNTKVDAMNVILHGMNSAWMMLDLVVSANPIQLMHFYWSVSFGICYIVFNLIYYWSGGVSREGKRSIYSVLNWDKPWETVGICLTVLGFLALLHLVVYVVTRYRSRSSVRVENIV